MGRKVERIWKELEEGKNIMKIYCLKKSLLGGWCATHTFNLSTREADLCELETPIQPELQSETLSKNEWLWEWSEGWTG